MNQNLCNGTEFIGLQHASLTPIVSVELKKETKTAITTATSTKTMKGSLGRVGGLRLFVKEKIYYA